MFGKSERRTVEEVAGPALRRVFEGRFLPLYRATKGVRVSGPLAAAERIVQGLVAGEVESAQRARLLAGDVLLEAAGVGTPASRSVRYDSQRRLRELGIVVADGVLEEVEVDVGAVLEAALESDAWERRG